MLNFEKISTMVQPTQSLIERAELDCLHNQLLIIKHMLYFT